MPLGFCEGDRRPEGLIPGEETLSGRIQARSWRGLLAKVRLHEVIDLDVGQQRNLPKSVLLPILSCPPTWEVANLRR